MHLSADHYRRIIDASGITQAMRLDANETALFARQLEQIDATLYDKQYPENLGMQIVPVKTDIDPGAETLTYRVMDYAGKAQPIANYADDLPRIDVFGAEVSVKMYSWGESYTYSMQDLRRARMSGLQIEARKAEYARQVMARTLDEVIFSGHTQLGITGFVNNASVPLVTPTTGSWATATGDQILADLLKLERSIMDATNGIETPDTLVLPANRYHILQTKVMGAGYETTVLDLFKRRAEGIREVVKSYRLNTADAAGTGPRVVAFTRRPDKLEALVPIEFEQFPPEVRNLAWNVNCHARCGGVAVHYPYSMAYMDGV